MDKRSEERAELARGPSQEWHGQTSLPMAPARNERSLSKQQELLV